jgi:hypothetical protein
MLDLLLGTTRLHATASVLASPSVHQEFTYSKFTVTPTLQEFLKNIYYAGPSLLPSLVAGEVLSKTQWPLYGSVTSVMHDTAQTFYFWGFFLDLGNILPWQTCFIWGVG